MEKAGALSLAACVALSAILVPGARAQSLHPQDSSAPRFLNLVYQTLRPGGQASYAAIERAIAHSYAELRIPAYWVALQSLTGRPTSLSLNLFNSFDQAERAVAGIAAAMRAYPDLARRQTDLLTKISDEQTILTVRRDDIAPAAPINLAATMHLLRITTLTAAPGHDAALAAALRAACTESELAQPAGRCLVYEADAGASGPTFIVLVPLMSLADVGADIATRHGLAPTAATSVPGPSRSPPDLAKAVCSSSCSAVESQIYVVNPEQSHMPIEFAAGDPAFWTASGVKHQGLR
jgi:hypothetical protein